MPCPTPAAEASLCKGVRQTSDLRDELARLQATIASTSVLAGICRVLVLSEQVKPTWQRRPPPNLKPRRLPFWMVIPTAESSDPQIVARIPRCARDDKLCRMKSEGIVIPSAARDLFC